jgi:hypothetical protein
MRRHRKATLLHLHCYGFDTIHLDSTFFRSRALHMLHWPAHPAQSQSFCTNVSHSNSSATAHL